MRRNFFTACLFIWTVTGNFSRGFAQADLPVVNVFAPVNSLAEGTNAYSGDTGYFVLTSNQTNGISLNLEFSGTATIADFDPFVSTDRYSRLSSFPTNVSIPPGTNSVTFSFRAARDGLVEGTETLSLTILADASYRIGVPPEATVKILDRTTFAANATNLFFFVTNRNFALAPSLSFPVYVGGAYQTLLVRMLIDNAVVDELYLPVPLGGPNTVPVTMTWTNPVSGPHALSFVAFNETGGTSRLGPFNINVAFGRLNPTKTFSLSSPNGVRVGTNIVVSRFPSAPDVLGFVEFDVPASATNLSGAMTLQRTMLAGSGPAERVDVFAYAAGPTNGVDILKIPKEFVGAIETNALLSNDEVDVTAWIHEFAGRKLGIMLALPEQVAFNNRQYGFAQFAIVLDPPGAVDAGPQIHLVEQPPKIVRTNLVTIRAEIRDPDSEISRAYLVEDNYVIAIDAPLTPYAPGTNIVTFRVEVASGPHVLSVRAASLGKTALSEQFAFFVDPDFNFAPHRWLGSQNNSQSFYVVDAAGRAHVWGRNDFGQLGLGFTNSSSEYGLKRPVTLVPPEGLKFRQIASARKYAVGLMDNGSLYEWGTNRLVPTSLPLPRGIIGFRSVSAMEEGPVAIDEQNNVWVNNYTGWSSVGRTGIVVKAAANSYAYGLTNGIVFWSVGGGLSVIDYAPAELFYGINPNGQLFGNSATFGAQYLLTADGVATWRRVFASDTYVLALDNEDRMFAWDRGFFVFRSSNVGAQIPFPLGVSNFIDVAVTTTAAMALTDKGELYAWGDAAPGVWTDPTATTAHVPELVGSLPNLLDPNASDVAAAFISTAATATDLTLKLASPRGFPITIEMSDDLQKWMTYTNFTATANTSAVTLPLDATTGKFFRVAP